MRTIATVAGVCMCAYLHGQVPRICDILNRKGTNFYTEWVDVDTMSKSDIYARALEWMLASNTVVDSITHMSRLGGSIAGHGSLRVHDIRVGYTFAVTATDGRYQYAVKDFSMSPEWAGDVATCAAIDYHVRGLVGALAAYVAMRPR